MDADRAARSFRWPGRSPGISFVDALLVLVVIAMLSSAAVHAWREYLRRDAVAHATDALGAGRVVIERHFFDRLTYVGAPCPADTDDFEITCELAPLEFTLTATGTKAMEGFVYTLDQGGRRTSAGPWGAGPCWITRRGDKC